MRQEKHENPIATVLYEDSKIGKEFPLHNLVMRIVEENEKENEKVRKLLHRVHGNPRKGIDNVLRDVRNASVTAGLGRLFVLVDKDVVIRHVNKNAKPNEPRLSREATDEEIANAIQATAGDYADRIKVFLLRPNMEGLIETIECGANGRWADAIAGAKSKKRLSRDVVLGEVVKSDMKPLRTFILGYQPGLGALAMAIFEALSDADNE